MSSHELELRRRRECTQNSRALFLRGGTGGGIKFRAVTIVTGPKGKKFHSFILYIKQRTLYNRVEEDGWVGAYCDQGRRGGGECHWKQELQQIKLISGPRTFLYNVN